MSEEESNEEVKKVPKIIICGGPASGKGTQCDFIVKELNVVHLSSGDMLRAAVEAGTEEGIQAKEFMNEGKLVPDELIIGIVAKRVREQDCLERGFVLDGFPRTSVQVEAMLAAGVQCDVFLQIDVSDEAIIERVSGRRMDPETGKIYHMKYLPPPEDVVHRLEQREDDTEEKIKVRLATYHENLAGIVTHFEGCKVVVNGNDKKPDEIWGEIREGLQRFPHFNLKAISNVRRRVPRIIICGGPASGKGTQCDFIVKELNVVHLSSGDMLRAAVEAGTEEGIQAKEFMNEGKLVPDELIIGIVAKRVREQDCLERGFVLDGFPRTSVQVEAMLAAGVQCDVFLQIDVSDEAIIERVSGRRMDPETGKIYHMKYLPPPEDVVHRLEQREDDTEEKIKVRLATYHENLAGIVTHFEGCKVVVNGNDKKPDEIWGEIRRRLRHFIKFRVVFLLGAPSSGKSTLCKKLHGCSNYQELSVSELLDKEITENSQRAQDILEAVNAGKCVSVDVIISLLRDAMLDHFQSQPHASTKFLIDGFPNTRESVDAWYLAMGHCAVVDMFLHLDMPTNALKQTLQQKMSSEDADTCIAKHVETASPLLESLDRIGKLRVVDAWLGPEVAAKQASRLLLGISLINPLERTFAMIKPDVVSDGKAHEIHKAIVNDGRLRVLVSKFVQFDGKATEEFYDKDFKSSSGKNKLKAFMCSGPSLCLVLEGFDAVAVWREMMGPQDARLAVQQSPKSFRAVYGSDECRNACHGSDCEGSALREIDFLLSPSCSGHRLSPAAGASLMEAPSMTSVLSEKSLGGLPLESTCAVMKPLTAEKHYDEIMGVILSQGFEVVSELKTKLTERRAKALYQKHEDKDFFEDFIRHMTSRPLIALHLRRADAVAAWRKLMGPTQFRPDDICLRSFFASGLLENAVGGSVSREVASLELDFFFHFGLESPGDALVSPKKPLPPLESPSKLPPLPPQEHRQHRSPYELSPVSRDDISALNTYNKSEIHPVLAPVISKLMMERPSDVKKFVLKELESLQLSDHQ